MNTPRPSSLQARGSCGKGSSCNYITLIYGRQRKDGERMETELPWRQSKIRSLKKHKSIGLHHKTWWIGDNCVGMNVVRETLATRWGQTDLKWWKRTKLWKNSHNCNTGSFLMNLLMEHKQVQKHHFKVSQLWGTDDNCLAQADAVDAVLSVNWGKWWNCEQCAQACTAALAGGSICPISPLRPNNYK